MLSLYINNSRYPIYSHDFSELQKQRIGNAPADIALSAYSTYLYDISGDKALDHIRELQKEANKPGADLKWTYHSIIRQKFQRRSD